jgi:hypothetical protein
VLSPAASAPKDTRLRMLHSRGRLLLPSASLACPDSPWIPGALSSSSRSVFFLVHEFDGSQILLALRFSLLSTPALRPSGQRSFSVELTCRVEARTCSAISVSTKCYISAATHLLRSSCSSPAGSAVCSSVVLSGLLGPSFGYSLIHLKG